MKPNQELNLKTIAEIKPRLVARWFEDGLYEMYIGAIFLCVGSAVIARRIIALPSGKPYFAILIPVMIIGSIYGGGRILSLLKARYVYPFTGYAVFKKEPRKKRISRFLIVFSVILMLFIAISLYRIERFEAVVSCGMLCYLMIVLFLFTRRYRFLVFAIIAIFETLFFFISDTFLDLGFGVSYVSISPFLLVSGLVSFVRFRSAFSGETSGHSENMSESDE